jgi:hypothetical protein
MKKLAISIGLVAAVAAPSAFAQERPAPPTGRIEAAPEPSRPAPPTGRVEHEGLGEKEFGNAGVLAIGGTTSADFHYVNHSNPSPLPGTNDIVLSIAPDVQYFVIEGLSLGGTVSFIWDKPNQGDSTTAFGIGPTVGYNVWLTPGQLSLWPQATFSFINASTSVPAGTGGGTVSFTHQVMNVGVFVPLLIHPVKHFHFGVGPYFDVDVSAKDTTGSAPSTDGTKDMHVGLKFEVAGWL